MKSIRSQALLLTVITTSFLLSACGSRTPPNYGVFLMDGRKFVEIPLIQAVSGEPNKDELRDIPSTREPRPVVALWHPNIVPQLLSLRGNAGYDDDIPFTLDPKREGLLELQPRQRLDDDIYCVVQPNPMDIVAAVWCFEVR